MVATAGQTSPFHNTTEVHSAFRSPHEPQILIHKQIASTWCPATATGRSIEQATSTSGTGASQSAAQNAYANMQMSQYQQSPLGQAPPVYNHMYSPHQQAAPPPYPSHTSGFSQPMGVLHQVPSQMAAAQYNPGPSLYTQATTRAGRQRASTLDQQAGGIPPSIQRVASHLDPNAPIRLQPSPAYYPPPSDVHNEAANARRRGSRAASGRNRNFIQSLEDRTMEEGFMNQPQWH